MFGIFYYSHLHVQGPTVLLFKQKRKYIQLRKRISLKRIINHLSYGQTYNGHFFQTHHIFKMQIFIAGIYFQIQKHSRPSNCVYMSRQKGGKKEIKRLNNILLFTQGSDTLLAPSACVLSVGISSCNRWLSILHCFYWNFPG